MQLYAEPTFEYVSPDAAIVLRGPTTYAEERRLWRLPPPPPEPLQDGVKAIVGSKTPRLRPDALTGASSRSLRSKSKSSSNAGVPKRRAAASGGWEGGENEGDNSSGDSDDGDDSNGRNLGRQPSVANFMLGLDTADAGQHSRADEDADSTSEREEGGLDTSHLSVEPTVLVDAALTTTAADAALLAHGGSAIPSNNPQSGVAEAMEGPAGDELPKRGRGLRIETSTAQYAEESKNAADDGSQSWRPPTALPSPIHALVAAGLSPGADGVRAGPMSPTALEAKQLVQAKDMMRHVVVFIDLLRCVSVGKLYGAVDD